MKNNFYQVKFSVQRPKFKNIIITGIVLANDQPTAVKAATDELKQTIESTDQTTKAKLVSCTKLAGDFFINVGVEQEELVTNK